MKNLYKFTALCTTPLYGASKENPSVVRTAEFTNKAKAKQEVRNRLSKGNLIDEYTLIDANSGEVLMSYKRKSRKPTAPWFDSINPRG